MARRPMDNLQRHYWLQLQQAQNSFIQGHTTEGIDICIRRPLAIAPPPLTLF